MDLRVAIHSRSSPGRCNVFHCTSSIRLHTVRRLQPKPILVLYRSSNDHHEQSWDRSEYYLDRFIVPASTNKMFVHRQKQARDRDATDATDPTTETGCILPFDDSIS